MGKMKLELTIEEVYEFIRYKLKKNKKLQKKLQKAETRNQEALNIGDVVCRLPIDIGTFIAERRNINNYPEKDGYEYKNIYYQLCNGRFEFLLDDGVAIFNGSYLKCMGSDFWHNLKGKISGLSLIENGNFKIINKLPDSLF